MKNHEAAYNEDDELPPINGGSKMKPSKYSMGKTTKSGQTNSTYGGSTSSSLKPKSIAPVGGSNGSSTNRSGMYQDTSTIAKKAPTSNVAQLPLKKVNLSSKPKKHTGQIPSSIGSSSSYGDVSGALSFLAHSRRCTCACAQQSCANVMTLLHLVLLYTRLEVTSKVIAISMLWLASSACKRTPLSFVVYKSHIARSFPFASQRS